MTSKKNLADSQTHLLNPLEIVEDVILSQDWAYQRLSPYEILAEIEGRWGEYRLQFFWQDEVNILHFTCLMDLPVNMNHAREMYELLALINERLLLGHFEVFPEEGVPAFRYSFIVSGPRAFHNDLLEEAIDLALNECERFFPAFQFVMSGEKKAREAASVAIMDTVGEA